MKKTSLILTIFVAILISFLGVYLTDFSNKYYEAHEVYRVYLEGKSIGLINSKKDLEKLIDKEQEKIKLQYNVDKVYIPKGLEIQKETTYSNNIKKEEEIYNDIKDKESFTIEGYKVTIVTTKTTLDETTGEKIEKDVTNYVYIFYLFFCIILYNFLGIQSFYIMNDKSCVICRASCFNSYMFYWYFIFIR